jgi:deoxyribodipyrimidine photolyase-related protein
LAILRFVLGDQLSRELSSLRGVDREHDVVLMAEVAEETTYVRHHKQKIALVLSAMRHFADELRAQGIRVDYVRLDDPANTGSFAGELARAVARHAVTQVIATEPGEWRVLVDMEGWAERIGIPVHIREDDRFMCSRAQFAQWAQGRRQYRMEHFYRDMRRRSGILMAGGEPEGGQWNFDHDNRKRLPARLRAPKRLRFSPDAMTREVLELVAKRFAGHFGDLDTFGWPVTRAQALDALDHFVREVLPMFGDYQDAMACGEPFLFHALLSTSLNVGLLRPAELCEAAEAVWRAGLAPLNAVEGFIRQVLGWREYVRGIYWLRMPAYANSNALGATRDLPFFYWSGETDMNCLRQAIGDTKRHAYAHHIQRLMVTGNFALLIGVEPRQIEEWYLAVYADAFDWVELPNTHGMVMFADGGLLASKPYAASGAYIDRMSDYCRGCVYDPKVKTGNGSCPFNALYWNFLVENRAVLGTNPRLAMPYRTLDGMSADRRADIATDAAATLARVTGKTVSTPS